MASSRPFCASILLLLVIESQLVMTSGPTGRPLLAQTILDCGGACQVRCSQSSRPNLCNRACGTCCTRCNCVPPGTSGNYDACPCYAAMKTRGRRKCP